MKRSSCIIIAACCLILLLAACSPRIYRPPALGAEYRFDEGLKPAKHPSTLFDKKMSKYLQDRGIEREPSPAKVNTAAGHRKDSAAGTPSGRKAAPTTPDPARWPASSDSSHNGPG